MVTASVILASSFVLYITQIHKYINKGGHICLKHHEWSKQWPNFQVGVNFSVKSSCKIVESVKECPLAVKERCDLKDLVISILYKRLWLDLRYTSNALSLWGFWGHKEKVFFYKIWKMLYIYIYLKRVRSDCSLLVIYIFNLL